MKKHFLLLIMTALCAIANAQSTLFGKYENTNGVSTVLVSKAMFRMMPNVNVGNRNIKKIASKIDNLRVLSCERQALIAKISKDAMVLYKKKPWEEVMRYKEGTGNTVIYMQPLGGGKFEYSLYTTEKGELQIISIVGNLSLEDIRSITQ